VLHLDLPGLVRTTGACASPGRVYPWGPEIHLEYMPGQQEPMLLLGMSTLQRPELRLDVSGQQELLLLLDVFISQWAELHLDVSTPQWPMLHLDVSAPQGLNGT
jgi:hypothetical protein